MNRITLTILFIFATSVIAIASCFQIFSPDLFWHLRMGRDFIHEGLSPFRDHYSFTLPEEKIILVAWPFQVLIAFLYDLFGGLRGVVVLRFALWMAALFGTYRAIRAQSSSLLVLALALPFFLCAILYHSEPRPDLVSFALTPFLFLLLFAWRKNPTRKQIVAIAIFMFVWSNIHASSIMGYLMIGAFLLDRALVLARAKEHGWVRLVVTGAIWSAVGFLNVDLMHPYLAQRTFDPEWADIITEYETIPFRHQWPFLQAYWIVLVVALLGMLKRREWAGAFLACAIGLKTAELTKLFPHLIALTLPFVAGSFDDYLKMTKARKWTTRAIQVLILAVTVHSARIVVDRAFLRPLHPVTGSLDPHYFPVDVAEYAKREKLVGNVMNAYSIGGYLLHELAPQMKVYVDGRSNILYPIELVKRGIAAEAGIADFDREVDRYDIGFVVASFDNDAYLVHTALDSGRFKILYLGTKFALLRKGPTTHETSSRLFLHPECLAASQKKSLEAELAQTPENSFLRAYLTAALAGLDGRELPARPPGVSFYHRLEKEISWRRGDLLGAQASLLRIAAPDATDFADLAEIDCELGGCRSAEAILNHTPSIGLNDFTLHRVLWLLKRIETQNGLKIFTPERIERTKKRASNKWDYSRPLRRDQGCPSGS